MVDKSEIKHVSIFAELTEPELTRLAEVIEKKIYARGKRIYSEGGSGGRLYVIQSGQVIITRVIREGEQQTLSSLSPGMYFGGISLIDGLHHSATATAGEDTELLLLDKADFERLAAENPLCGVKIHRALVQSLCEYLRQINEKFMDMLQYVSLDR
jgi:CRP/FNR family cyclic AMP-dependent transcriptional regulator